jgi:hypothetical protein
VNNVTFTKGFVGVIVNGTGGDLMLQICGVCSSPIDASITGTEYGASVDWFYTILADADGDVIRNIAPITFLDRSQIEAHSVVLQTNGSSQLFAMNAFDVTTIAIETPLPAALPLFASILAGGGLIAWAIYFLVQLL